MASREEIAGIFPAMITRFIPEKAEGVNAGIQFDLSGDNGGLYWLRIQDQSATYGEGKIDNAKMTIKASGDDYAALASGTLNPMQAFMSGKVKVQGDMGLALKFMNMFDQSR